MYAIDLWLSLTKEKLTEKENENDYVAGRCARSYDHFRLPDSFGAAFDQIQKISRPKAQTKATEAAQPSVSGEGQGYRQYKGKWQFISFDSMARWLVRRDRKKELFDILNSTKLTKGWRAVERCCLLDALYLFKTTHSMASNRHRLSKTLPSRSTRD
jgi:hypothetical protein